MSFREEKLYPCCTCPDCPYCGGEGVVSGPNVDAFYAGLERLAVERNAPHPDQWRATCGECGALVHEDGAIYCGSCIERHLVEDPPAGYDAAFPPPAQMFLPPW